MDNKPNSFAEAFVMSLPGVIQRSEAEGQQEIVSNVLLPKEVIGLDDKFCDSALAAIGFVIGEEVDDLFREVQLPPGWTYVPTSHPMWSEVRDADGCKRISVFYKAAFYDRRADMSFERRYVTNWYSAPPSLSSAEEQHAVVFDNKTKQVLFDAGPRSSTSREEARLWLDANYPAHGNPFVYWDDLSPTTKTPSLEEIIKQAKDKVGDGQTLEQKGYAQVAAWLEELQHLRISEALAKASLETRTAHLSQCEAALREREAEIEVLKAQLVEARRPLEDEGLEN